MSRPTLARGRPCAERYDAGDWVRACRSTSSFRACSMEICRRRAGLRLDRIGDVCAGIVGGLAARGAAPLTALLWGVWLHGETGRILFKKVGALGFLAREIPAEVPALLPT